MTDDQMILKEKIQTSRAILKEAQSNFDKLVHTCSHYVKPIKNYRESESNSVKCEICGEYLGWYCPESPNHVCDYEHYDEEMGGRYIDEDSCIYCGHPEERK